MKAANSRRLLVAASSLAIAACANGPAESAERRASEVSDVPASTVADFTPPTNASATSAVPATPATTTSTTTPAATTPTTFAATTTSSTTTVVAPTTAPPPPCRPTPELQTASARQVTLRADGLATPSPLIIVLHGYTSTSVGIERVSNLSELANANNVAVAYPLGTPTGVGGFGWNSGASVFTSSGADDVAALDEMLTVLEATGCIDMDRVVVSGESNGGGMTLAALCDPRLEGRFRSAVMVIPAVDDGVLNRCGGSFASATPLIAVAGRIDLTTPFEGGNGLLPQLGWFDRVAAARGCSGVDDADPITSFADRYGGAACGSCTELIAVSDGPHTWPGSPEGNGNLVAGTFDLNRRIVADLLAPAPGCLSAR